VAALAGAYDRFVPEEGVLHAGLLMVTRLLLPSSTSELLHPRDRPIAETGPWPAPRHGRRLGRRDYDGRASRAGRLVKRDRVIGGIGGYAGDLSDYALDEMAACRGIVDDRLCDRLRTYQAGLVDTEMQRSLGRNPTECEIELLTSARQRSVVRDIEIDPHHR
jgi:hypothetical protein